MARFRAVVSVVGADQKGVVAQFATFLAERGVNIEDIQQQVVHGNFLMDMLVDLEDMSLSLDELITGLLELGQQINMQVRVALHDQKRVKRIALLCSSGSTNPSVLRDRSVRAVVRRLDSTIHDECASPER